MNELTKLFSELKKCTQERNANMKNIRYIEDNKNTVEGRLDLLYEHDYKLNQSIVKLENKICKLGGE